MATEHQKRLEASEAQARAMGHVRAMSPKMMRERVAEIRAAVEAGKQQAMARFERDWGTQDVGAVANALRQTIPISASPADAARKAQALTKA